MIVLASKSASRRTMLAAAGVAFEVRPAAIDERALEARLAAAGPGEVALALAEAKALSVDGAEHAAARRALGSEDNHLGTIIWLWSPLRLVRGARRAAS